VVQAASSPSHLAPDEQSHSLAEEAPRSKEAFARLYVRLAPRLYRYFWVHTRCDALAEDLVSETFLEALISLSAYRFDKGSVSAWLFGIGKRALSRRSFEFVQVEISDHELQEVVDGFAESQIAAVEERIDLWQAVGKLSNLEREVVALKFGAGLLHREVAEITGLHEVYVGVAVYRALQKLRSLLGGEGRGDARKRPHPGRGA